MATEVCGTGLGAQPELAHYWACTPWLCSLGWATCCPPCGHRALLSPAYCPKTHFTTCPLSPRGPHPVIHGSFQFSPRGTEMESFSALLPPAAQCPRLRWLTPLPFCSPKSTATSTCSAEDLLQPGGLSSVSLSSPADADLVGLSFLLETGFWATPALPVLLPPWLLLLFSQPCELQMARGLALLTLIVLHGPRHQATSPHPALRCSALPMSWLLCSVCPLAGPPAHSTFHVRHLMPGRPLTCSHLPLQLPCLAPLRLCERCFAFSGWPRPNSS